jgi:glycosyltransferase involved in cell wall biosynthesis
VISSDLVPYVCEYLLGSEPEKYIYSKFDQPILVGEGAIVVQADDVNGFAQALMLLLTDDELRSGMGQKAYHATIPYFTWGFMVERFLKIIRVDPAISGAL